MERIDRGAVAQGVVFESQLPDGLFVQGEGAAQVGVFLPQPFEVRLSSFVGLWPVRRCRGLGGLGDAGPEVGVDQVGVVAVEDGVRDGEAPLDGGVGRAPSAGGRFVEDGVRWRRWRP
ncbi:hypothetical protein [Streptomyces spiramyceticus]|uniref:hypothetical protein n=1 Tax=Streptomyces spiramyceticus TaxID=299717 RepID=UPI00237C269D|nr:hypothetical protein [Streptomyces spiramyceticus]